MRPLRLIVLSLWLGAIVYFAAAVAPNVFSVLATHDCGSFLAGEIVGHALNLLHYAGMVCATLFLLVAPKRIASLASALVLGMLILTGISQLVITPGIHAIRHGYRCESMDAADRSHFEFLHRASTSTESLILLLGICALVVESRRRD